MQIKAVSSGGIAFVESLWRSNYTRVTREDVGLLFDYLDSKDTDDIISILDTSVNQREIIVAVFCLSCLYAREGTSLLYDDEVKRKITLAVSGVGVEGLFLLDYFSNVRDKLFGADTFLVKLINSSYESFCSNRSTIDSGDCILISSKAMARSTALDRPHLFAHYSLIISLVRMLVLAYGKDKCFYVISLNHFGFLEEKAQEFKLSLVNDAGLSEANVSITSPQDNYLNLFNMQLSRFKYSFCMGGVVVGNDSMRKFLYLNRVKTIYFKFNNNNGVDSFSDYVVGSEFSEGQRKRHNCVQFSYPTQTELMQSKPTFFKWSWRDVSVKKIVTVGSGDRLIQSFKRMTDNELFDVISFVNANQLCWIFIGNELIRSELGDLGFDMSKIISYGFVDNLEEYYSDADLVMYLPRISGGGTGLLRAASLGIPVIAFKGGDAEYYLSGKFIMSSLKEALELAESVLTVKSEANRVSSEGLEFIANELSLKAAAGKLLRFFP